MKSNAIKSAWQKLSGPTGPVSMENFESKKEPAREYASLVLSSEDKIRIKAIGKKYLVLAAEGDMTKEQFVGFLHNAACYEHWHT